MVTSNNVVRVDVSLGLAGTEPVEVNAQAATPQTDTSDMFILLKGEEGP